MLKTCEFCGAVFEASANHGWQRFCSPQCRQRAHRSKAVPLIPSEGLAVLRGDDARVFEAVSGARRASNDLAKLSATASVQLRPGCARVSRAITDAIDAEGW